MTGHPEPHAPPARVLPFVLIGLAVALVIGVVVSGFASSAPDGLESAVIRTPCDGDEDCLAEVAGDAVFTGAPLPDYENTPVSGLVGVLATFLLASGLALLAVRLRARRTAG